MGAQRRDVVYLAWSTNRGRVLELAALLDARPLLLSPRWLRARRLVALRYVVCACWTLLELTRRRPTTVIVINPPVPAACCAALYGRFSGARVVIDSHPGGFGAQGDVLSAALQPLHRWAVRGAAATLVTGEHWASRVREWGGVPLVVHEPAAHWTAEAAAEPTPGRAKDAPPRVLFLGTYGRDEPVRPLFEAARRLPGMSLRVTGDPALAPGDLLERTPGNVVLLGYLEADDYRAEVLAADLVVVLTTEPTSVMRAAYEAVYALRPLVVSDWPGLIEVFPHAVHVANTSEQIAAGISRAVDDISGLQRRAATARELQTARWDAQLDSLRHVVG